MLKLDEKNTEKAFNETDKVVQLMDILCELCVYNSWDGTVCTMLPRMVTL